MRIAILSDLSGFSWAGCEELWAELARRALQQGHKVAFFPSRLSVAPQKLEPLQRLGLEVIQPPPAAAALNRVREQVSGRLASLVAPALPLFSRVKNFAPDVVLLTAGDALPRPDFLRELHRAGVLAFPYVLACHNSYLFGMPPSDQEQQEAARYYLGARRVLFVAHRTRKETEHLLAANLPNAIIVRNPINMTDSSLIPMPSGPTIRMATMGRLAMNSKGQDILLAALGSPSFKDQDWLLSIYGDGPHQPHLQRLAQHYRIADRVVFPGHVHDIRAVWAEHHLHVLPSRNESAPLVIVESMLCGRPSVATDVGGVREWITEPETGFVAEAASIESFQSALERAWAAQPQWSVIGRQAREKALSMLDPDPGNTLLSILQQAASPA